MLLNVYYFIVPQKSRQSNTELQTSQTDETSVDSKQVQQTLNYRRRKFGAWKPDESRIAVHEQERSRHVQFEKPVSNKPPAPILSDVFFSLAVSISSKTGGTWGARRHINLPQFLVVIELLCEIVSLYYNCNEIIRQRQESKILNLRIFIYQYFSVLINWKIE